MKTGITFHLIAGLLASVAITAVAAAQSDVRLTPETADVHRTPGIMVRNGGIYFTWADGPNVFNADHFVLARWNPYSSDEPSTIASIIPEGITDPPYFVDSMSIGKNDGLVRFDN